MSLRTLFAFGQAGGQEAIRGLTTALANAAPKTMGEAGRIMDVNDLDNAGDIIVRYREDVRTAQAEYDALDGNYQTQVHTGEVLQSDITKFQGILADDNASAEAKTKAQSDLDATNTAFDKLVAKLDPMMPKLTHAKEMLDRAKSDLADATAAYEQHADRSVHRVEETREAQHDLEHAQREAERAKQKATDAKTLAGLAGPDDEQNPALAAVKRATQKLQGEADKANLLADTLHRQSSHDEDDPVLKAAMARATGGTGDGASAADRFAALKTKAA